MKPNFLTKSSVAIAVAVAVAVGLSGCGHSTKSQGVSYSTPSNAVTFRGVSVTPPSGWKVINADTVKYCAPQDPHVVIVGDISSSADCPAPSGSTPGQIYIRTEMPGRMAPAQLTSIGALQGWIDKQDSTESIAVIPGSNVDIDFHGDAVNELQAVLASVQSS